MDSREYFKMAVGDKVIAKVPLSWKKFFSQGVVMSHKMKNCVECKNNILCENCDKLVNQKKEFSTILSEIKGKAPTQFGHMLPEYITT